MIEFQPGSGPDSKAVGVALEEMFLDYRIAPGEPAPAIVEGGQRIEGMEAILLFLAGRSGRFLPDNQRNEAARWLGMAASGAVDLETLDKQVADSRYILGDISIADMAIYPQLARQPLDSHANIARWVQRMGQRSATGRGMGAVLRA